MKRIALILLLAASSALADPGEKIKSGLSLTIESGATLQVLPGGTVIGLPSLTGTMSEGDIAVFNNSTGQLRAGTDAEVMTFEDNGSTFIPFFDVTVTPHRFRQLLIGPGLLISGTTLNASPATYTVATLPASPNLGDRAVVSDGDASLAWGATVVNSGSGATKYFVWWNGTNWTVFAK